jgi:hypothetical protein
MGKKVDSRSRCKYYHHVRDTHIRVVEATEQGFLIRKGRIGGETVQESISNSFDSF